MRIVFDLQGKLKMLVGDDTKLREISFDLGEGEVLTVEASTDRLRELLTSALGILEQENCTVLDFDDGWPDLLENEAVNESQQSTERKNVRQKKRIAGFN